MFRKYWIVTPMTARYRYPIPALALMYGHRMYSPEPTPTPARITLGPRTLRSGSGSGMSRYSIGGRWSLRASGAYCGSTPVVPRPNRSVVVPRVLTSFANVLTFPRGAPPTAAYVADATGCSRGLAR